MSCVNPIIGGTWFPRVERTEVKSWHDYVDSDPFDDIRQAKAIIEKATGRPAVAITLSPESHEYLESHPDVLDRLLHGGGQSPMCTVTVACGSFIVASASYRDPADARKALAIAFDVPAVQTATIRVDPFALRDGKDLPLAVVYNDAMAVELFLKEDPE